MYKLLSSLVAVAAIGTGLVIIYVVHQVPEKPAMELQIWWGTGLKPKEEDRSIRPFKIDFNESVRYNTLFDVICFRPIHLFFNFS